jgi:hypothetical protein
MLGIQGWRDYHLAARVGATVVQSAGSTDGLYTIDLRIQHLNVGSQMVELLRPSFIRIEVFPSVRKGAPLPVNAGDELCIGGKLMWDGDGFLEIHPKRADEIRRGNCPYAIASFGADQILFTAKHSVIPQSSPSLAPVGQ